LIISGYGDVVDDAGHHLSKRDDAGVYSDEGGGDMRTEMEG
jgi:hypothetical protein